MTAWQRIRHLFILLALLLPALVSPTVMGDTKTSTRIAVIYPQVREPYRSVFRSISEGIATEAAASKVYEIPADEDSQSVLRRIGAQPFDAMILLGKRGLDLSAAMNTNTPRIVSAVFARPQDVNPGVRVISLTPAPQRLFETLRALAPTVRRIHVIHGNDANDWLIERARDDARQAGYELITQRMENLRDGANAYRELLRRMQSSEDALWLLQASPFLDESSVLQMVLRSAWDRNLVVFSSNPSHVPKGALFALFPDNRKLGRYLARQAAHPAGQAPLEPLSQLDTAINIRTADHLGLGLDARDPRFDMVFPSR